MSEVVSIFSMKRCPSCKTEKPLETEFWKGQAHCIPCSKEKQKNSWNSRTPKKRLEQHLKYKYDLTIQELAKALEEQKGGCAICSDTLPDLMVYNNRRRGYAIDHNHETGKFRGILCLSCNSMLGMAKDSEVLLEKAASYLKERGSYHELRITKKAANNG
jgi:hypothetical protein